MIESPFRLPDSERGNSRRLSNGVRARDDGNRLRFNDKHRFIREKNPDPSVRRWYMSDVDALLFDEWDMIDGIDLSKWPVFLWPENRLFVEYCVQGNEPNVSYGAVAVFECKRTLAAAREEKAKNNHGFQRWLTREIGHRQPTGARPSLFLVIGNDEPWQLTRVNLTTGEWERTWQLNESSWLRVWETAEITVVRRALDAHLRSLG